MAMKLGYNTKKLFIGPDLKVTNVQEKTGFNPITGQVNIPVWYDSSGGTGPSVNPHIATKSGWVPLSEDHYIDLGIITDEREELTMGGLAVSAPGTSVSQRVFWAIGGKVLRVSISGTILDGVYTGIGGSSLNGKSNSSVFKYKMNKLIAYQRIQGFSTANLLLHVVQYRRKYMTESADDHGSDATNLAKWIITGYSCGFIQGTRNLSYTISLDMANNIDLVGNDPLNDGIGSREFGDL